jgi:hypothetical protein
MWASWAGLAVDEAACGWAERGEGAGTARVVLQE